MSPPVSRGFSGRRLAADPHARPAGRVRHERLPGPLGRADAASSLDRWDFSIVGEVDEPRRWTWEEFRTLPSEEIIRVGKAPQLTDLRFRVVK